MKPKPLLLLAAASMLLSFCQARTTIDFGERSPVLDGALEDPCWRKLPWHEGFTLIGTREPAPVQTRFRIFHDNRNIYLAAEALEPRMDRLRARKYSPGSAMIWMNDSLEINFTPDVKALVYYKFIIDSTGAICDLVARDDNTDTENYVCSHEWEGLPAFRIGCLKDRWILEAAFPLGAFQLDAGHGAEWRVNVARNRYAGDGPAQLSSWSHMPHASHMIPKAFNLVSLRNFKPKRFLLDIEDLRHDFQHTPEGFVCGVDATVHNNTGSFARFTRVATLTDLESGKSFVSREQDDLKRGTYRSRRQGVLCPGGGRYRLTLALYSRNTSPTLLRCVSRDLALTYCPMTLRIVRPPYRNNIYATMPDKTIEANIAMQEYKGIPLTVELVGENFRQVREIAAATGSDTVTFDGAALPEGSYFLQASGRRGAEVISARQRIRRLPRQKGEVWFDRNGAAYIDGSPFLPFGWYATHGRRPRPWLNSYLNQAKFASTKAAFTGTMETFEKYGLRTMMFPFQDLDPRGWVPAVIFKDPDTRTRGLTPRQKEKIVEFVTAMAPCEGLLGWYMADEPECRDNNPRWYEEAREIIADIDPYHPCIMLNWGIDGIRTYYKGADVLMPDCYPQYFEDGSTGHGRWSPSDWAKASTALRPAWQMPLMTSWPALARDGRTRGVPASYFDQRSQFFQALIHNVKGFNMYAWHDSQRFSSFIIGPDDIGRTLMALRDYWLVNSTPQGVAVATTPETPRFQAGVKELAPGRFCLVAVNTSLKKTTARFSLKNRFGGVLHAAGENRSLEVRDGGFSDVFQPNETHVYLTDRTQAEAVPGVSATVAAIERHRAARRKPGNLVGIGEMLEIDYIRYAKGQIPPGWPVIKASSDSRFYSTLEIGSLLYLLDGLVMPNRVEYTWSPKDSDKNPWLEIAMPEKRPVRLVKIYTPGGNLVSARVVTDTGKSALVEDNSSFEIEVPLEDTARSIRIEILKTRKPADGGDVEDRLLTEVEVY